MHRLRQCRSDGPARKDQREERTDVVDGQGPEFLRFDRPIPVTGGARRRDDQHAGIDAGRSADQVRCRDRAPVEILDHREHGAVRHSCLAAGERSAVTVDDGRSAGVDTAGELANQT
jgi:hypothetical protein